jgi:hypothetical protein
VPNVMPTLLPKAALSRPLLLLLLLVYVITFTKGIYNYISETTHVSRICSVAAVPSLQFVLHVMLFLMLNTFVLLHQCLPKYLRVQCPIWLFSVVP